MLGAAALRWTERERPPMRRLRHVMGRTERADVTGFLAGLAMAGSPNSRRKR